MTVLLGAYGTVTKITVDDGEEGDQFGYSISSYGNTIAVGALFDDDMGTSSGSAYVFVRSANSWTQEAKLTADDGAVTASFGRSISIYRDTIAVGAYADDAVGIDSGSVYIFVRSGTSWTQQTKLVANDGASQDHFGISVSLQIRHASV